ncbi:hypothetical protein GTN27_04370 [Ochrobactrum sp. EEELCW01]|nr:hypothetical protein GTN27_04370 [Ochrobactrum sp. EEELCW01]
MTVPVPDQLEYISDADGVTKDFPYPKRFLQKDEIVVLLRDVDGVDTPQILNTHYTIAGSSWPSGGTISFITAPLGPNKVVRYRMTQAKQTVDLENNQRNDAPSVELQLDRLAMAIQDRGGTLTELLLRSVKMPFGYTGSTVLPWPDPNKLIGWNENGDGFANKDILPSGGLVVGEAGGEVLAKDTVGAIRDYLEIKDPAERSFDSTVSVASADIDSEVNFISTAGYYSTGDGGGALYKRAISEPTHPGKIQSADGTWWELAQLQPDLRMFGAKGDGVTSDSSAFQAAYNYIKAKGGGKVTVTETVSYYRVTTTVTFDNTVDFHLCGVGKPLIVDHATDGSHTFVVGNGVHSNNETLFSDLRIWGKDTPQNGNGIHATYAGGLRFERVNIFRHKGVGINANNCWTIGGRNSSVVGCLQGNVYLSGASGNGSLWLDCLFNDCPVDQFAFHIEGTSGGLPNGPHYGTTLIGCRFEHNKHTGLRALYSHALNIIGCYFEFNDSNAFRIETGCKGVNIHGNSIFTSSGLVLNADNVDIRGNQCEWDGSIDVGDSTNVSWGPNGVANKPNTIFGTTKNMEYQAFPAWVSFASTWISSGTQPVLGNGSLVFKYKRSGNTVHCKVELTMGSTTTFGAVGYGFRLPFNVAAGPQHLGTAGYLDASASAAVYNLVAVCEPGANYVGLKNAAGTSVGPTSPITFATGDKIYASFTYECVS